jgi:regulatory protein
MHNRKTISQERALTRAMQLCMSREYSEYDIHQKLKLWGLPEEHTDNVIDELIREGFIDNERFAQAFVKDKHRFNKWGKIKIQYELKFRNIPEHIIQDAYSDIPEYEYEQNLHELLKKKSLSLTSETDTFRKKEKLIRYAASKGYEQDLIWKMIDNFL